MNRKYTMEEEIFIVENYNKIPAETMAKKLNVSRKQYTGKKWYLFRIYANGKPPKTEKETRKVVEKIKARHTEIKTEEERQKKELEFIANNHETMSIKEMAIELGIHYNTVHKKWESLVQDGTINEMDSNVTRKLNVKKPKKTKIKPMPEEKIPIEVIENQKELKRKLNILDGNMKLGKRYRITENDYDKKKGPKRFEGELIQITDKHYTFKSRHRESFLKLDFVLGEYAIEEV